MHQLLKKYLQRRAASCVGLALAIVHLVQNRFLSIELFLTVPKSYLFTAPLHQARRRLPCLQFSALWLALLPRDVTPQWDPQRGIVSHFGEAEDAKEWLGRVGLNTIPSGANHITFFLQESAFVQI